MKMYRMKTLLIALLFMGIWSIPASSESFWNQMDEALKKAAERNKPVVAYFYHLQSRRIREDKKVWQHPLLRRYYDKFIFAQVEIDMNGDLVTKYSVKAFPSVLFFDSKGRELLSYRIEEDQLKITVLAASMNKVLNDIENFTLLESQIKKMKDNPRMILLYAKGLTNRTLFGQAEEHFVRLFQWDGISKKLLEEAQKEYTIMLFMQAARSFYQEKFNHCAEIMTRFLDKYPDDDAVPQAKFLLGMALYEGGKKKEGTSLLKELARNKQYGLFQTKAKMYLDEKKE